MVLVELFAALGGLAFFACVSFAVWIDYRKKKDERDALHRERMKALEMGYAPLDADVARAHAYASAAWAAGVIGLVVPIVVVVLTFVGTVIALSLHREGIAVPCIIAWSIAGILVLVVSVRSLGVIRQLPRPTPDARAPAKTGMDRGVPGSSTEFHEKRLDL